MRPERTVVRRAEGPEVCWEATLEHFSVLLISQSMLINMIVRNDELGDLFIDRDFIRLKRRCRSGGNDSGLQVVVRTAPFEQNREAPRTRAASNPVHVKL